MNWHHILELVLIVGCLGLGVVICAVLITPILNRHFRWMDEHPRWYE